MIRPAASSDIEAIVEMGVRFMVEHPCANAVDREAISAILEGLRTGGALIVAETEGLPVGFIAGALHYPWYDIHQEHPLAIELAWWVEPEHRASGTGIRLLRAFEAWAATTPATSVVVSDLVRDGEPSTGDMVGRLGYQLVERSHAKSTTWRSPQQH